MLAWLTVVALFAAGLGIRRFFIQSEIDAGSYFIATSSKYFMPSTYPQNNTKDILKWREMFDKSFQNDSSASLIPGTIRTLSIKSAENSSTIISLKIFAPKTISSTSSKTGGGGKSGVPLKPVLVWLPGGGFVLGGSSVDGNKAMQIFNRTSFVVVLVRYNLAPEASFPIPLLDVAVALKWIDSNIATYGGDARQIYIAGEDSGGTLALAITAVSKDSGAERKFRAYLNKIFIRGVILVNPLLDYTTSKRQSYEKYGSVNGMFTIEQLMWSWRMYLGPALADQVLYSPSNKHYAAVPARMQDWLLSKLPPVALLLARNDVVLDEGLELRDRLLRNKVSSTVFVYNSSVHGFFGTSLKSADLGMKDLCTTLLSWSK